MRIRASVVKNPGFCETNTQKNCREQKNLRTPLHPSFAYLRNGATESQPQQAYAGAGAGTAGGWLGGIVFRRGFLSNFWRGGIG
jgi:hypothetical protein